MYLQSVGTESFRLASIAITSDQVPSIILNTLDLSSPSRPEYHALSYTWNPPHGSDPTRYSDEDKCHILLNGSRFSVNPNLYDALFQLHRSCPQMPFWIDAICINQDDLQERKLQVAIMDRIFECANQVIIWLGKPFPKLELGLQVAGRMSNVAATVSKRIIREQKYHHTNYLAAMKEAYGLEPLSFDEADALITLFECRWFARQWVIQEVALAKQVDILCNEMSISFDKVGSTALFLHLSGLVMGIANTLMMGGKDTCWMQNIYIFQAERTHIVREWCKGKRSEWADVLPLVDFTAGTPEDATAAGQRKERAVGLVVLKLLMWTVGFDCSDRRDTVYGFAGIIRRIARTHGLDGIPQLLQPSYDLDTAIVLQNAATEILQATGNLAFLGVVKDPALRETPGLPSWVPDYPPVCMLNPMAGPNFRSLGKFDASQSINKATDKVNFHVDGKVLRVCGFLLSPVEAMGEPLKPMTNGNFTQCAGMLVHANEIYHFTNQPFAEAFWRTLLFDQDLSDRPAELPTTKHFQDMVLIFMILRIKKEFQSGGEDAVKAFLQTLGDMDTLEAKHSKRSPFHGSGFLVSCCRRLGILPEEGDDELWTDEQRIAWQDPAEKNAGFMVSLLATALGGRRPAITKKGHFACVFESTMVGDEIWIVSGCPTPLVLRNEGGSYVLVGEAYVHGVMHGEAVVTDTKWANLNIE